MHAEFSGAAITQTRRLVAPNALGQAYTTQTGGGLFAIELKSGKIALQSPSFEDLTSWIPAEARGNIRVALESRDGDDFHSFCQSMVRDAGEPYGETFLDRDKVLGRSITVRFFTRAPGPPGLRNPDWLLMVRAVKLTLVGVQPRQLAGESPAAGMRQLVWGQGRIPEAIGVFTADLSGGAPQQWTLQVAHARYLLDLEVASGTYDMEVVNLKPFEHMAMLFNLGVSKEEGDGASFFSRAAARLEYAATSALNIAQRSASWLARKALRLTHHHACSISEDDTAALSIIAVAGFPGGFQTSLAMDFVGGRVQVSHGGLDVLYFIADPAQPLDSNLRATCLRISSAKTGGGFDVHRPFVMSCTWGDGNFHLVCKRLSLNTSGKRVSSVEDVSQLLDKLKVSPGGGHLSDGCATLCVGQSDVYRVDS